jgi:pSer/pThr/pTyr-binding forkhead associated (FHA) protein
VGAEAPESKRSRAAASHEATRVSRAATCAACNGPVRAGWRFCKSCGAPLAGSGALPAWRHLLVEVARPRGPARRTHSLEGAVTVLGRRLADVVLQDGSVSGSHAAFEVEGEACHLRDLDSTNGTFVAVRGFETLWPGAVVLLGPHRLLYRRRDHDSPDARELALVTSGGREKATFPLHAEAVVVGASQGDVVLPAAAGFAKRHAEIAWTGTTHAVRSLSSTHPTWLLVRRRRTLQDQDRVRIGDTVYEYRRTRA